MQTKKLTVWGVAIIGILLLGAAGVYAFSFGKYEKVKSTGGVVSIPLSKVSDGKAHFYQYEDKGKTIAFFVVKAPDGTIKSAFDACDACYKSKKGYEQQGDRMNCKNCNQKFVINRLGPNATGGCNPGFLPHTAANNAITIKASDLGEGARYF
jgi:uncharacterized membrane protein